jgi:High potential iron-sulfur protein
MRTLRASDKMTKARAEYQDTPNGIYSCGNCTLFVAPSSCKVVEGEVSTDGWCKAFALAD